MGYKEQVTNLRTEALFQRSRFSRDMLACELEGAASSIETLLAERDAAIEELRGICWCCSNAKPWMDAFGDERLSTCDYITEQGVLARGGGKCKCLHWKWRGPQKGDADHGD